MKRKLVRSEERYNCEFSVQLQAHKNESGMKTSC